MDEAKLKQDFEEFEDQSLRRERNYALLQAAATLAVANMSTLGPIEQKDWDTIGLVNDAIALLEEIERRQK